MINNRRKLASVWSLAAALVIAGCGKQSPTSTQRDSTIVKETEADASAEQGPSMTVEDVVQSFAMSDDLPDQESSASDRAAWEASLVPEDQIKPQGAELASADFQLNDVAADQREIVDLRPNDTGIRNQGSEGTCTAFATVATLENLVKRFYGETVDISERHHWTTYANYQSTTSLQKASAAPIVSESTWPYQGSRPSSTTGLGIAKLNSYTTTSLSLTPIVESLRKGQPVVIAVGVLTSMMSPKQGGIITGGTQKAGAGHALAVTGAIIDASVPGGGYFIVKNSWGSGWGDKGYGYIAFDYCQRTWCSAYSIADASLFKNGVAVAKPNVAPTPVNPAPVNPTPVPSVNPQPNSPTAITAADFKVQPYGSKRTLFKGRYYYLAVVAKQEILQQIKSIQYDDRSSKYTVTNGAAADVRVSIFNLASPAFKTRSGTIETDDIIVTLRNGQTITLDGVKFNI
ncbi:MAG: C1 family peptidase [Proteobacteria bacterium]|nr:C1 family peptidase [Pseudomonadota bacterium]